MPTLANLFAITPPALPVGYCPNPPTWQQVANDLFNGAQITALVDTGNYQYNYGPTTPTVDNRIFPWLNTVDGLWYTFQGGMWISPYPIPASGDLLVMWKGVENGSANGLWSYDGGDGTDPSVPANVSATTGSFWQALHTIDGRVPIGVGNIPTSMDNGGPQAIVPAAAATTDNLGNHGEYDHMQAADEAGPHRHNAFVNLSSTGVGTYALASRSDGDYAIDGVNAPEPNKYPTSNPTGTQIATPVMQPWFGLFFIYRTARVWKTIAP